MISVNDPDARHTRKSQHARRDGYRAHVAADPQAGIITDEQLTKAAGQQNSDPAVAEKFLAGEAAQDGTGPAAAGEPPAARDDDGTGRGPLAWYGDTAYGTGELREAIGAAGHRAVIKPKPVQPAVPGGFTRDDFTVDEQAGAVTCPAGVTRAIPPARHVVFGAACRTCPLRSLCTTSDSGRVLSPHPLDHLLRRPRAVGSRPRAARRLRPAPAQLERVIAQVATRRGRRLKLRYRGVTRNHACSSAAPPR